MTTVSDTVQAPARRLRVLRRPHGDDRLLELVHDDRPQEDRHHVRHDRAGLLRDRRGRGAAAPAPARRARTAPCLTAAQYNELFTMHGTTMVFLMGMPLAVAFGNYLIPLQIGARDVAFPRLNAFGYWVFLMGGLFIYSSFFLGGSAPNGGWFGYTPLTSTPIGRGLPPRARPRLLGRRSHHPRHRVDDVGDQLHRHDPQHARARHDVHAHAGVHVDDDGDRVPHPVRDADHHGRADHGVLRPQLRDELLPARERR